MPDFSHEYALNLPLSHIAGIDEVGRGPLAGPVIAAACVLPPYAEQLDIRDSKKLGEKKREALAEELRSISEWGIGEASPSEIEELNILQASLLAMKRAIFALPSLPKYVLIDGNHIPDISIPARAIIKGDDRSLTIAAASIIAKTHRDKLMKKLAEKYPQYGWETNSGYPTRQHQEAVKKYGVTRHHRRSFAPIRNILSVENKM
ncbi:MAG: ribonuclease HII [Parvibaculales bacterium]